jgi:hypothetical protein
MKDSLMTRLMSSLWDWFFMAECFGSELINSHRNETEFMDESLVPSETKLMEKFNGEGLCA